MKDKEKSAQRRQEHLDYLAEMREMDRILMYGRFLDGAGGLIIYKGKNLEEVTEWVRQDPYVTHGARDYTIHEWEMQTDYTMNKPIG